jgi:predicted GNAT family N-acyltransferase
VEVVEVPAASTHDLRRRVLRSHAPALPVSNAEDDASGAFHLAVTDGGEIVAVASFSPQPFEGRPAVRLRGMAVEPSRQSQGLGAMLLDAAVERLRRDGATLLWANARLGALAFYERRGFHTVGEPFDDIGIPHVVVVRPLGPDVQSGDG